MAKLGDSKHYKDVFISPVDVIFKRDEVANVPRQFYVDWFDLFLNVAKLIYPPFTVPELPKLINFKENVCEYSPSTEIYYFISIYEFSVKGESDFSVTFKAFCGLHTYDGPDYIELSLNGIPSDYPEFLNVSSSIKFNIEQPLAAFYITADPEQLEEIEALFADQLKKKSKSVKQVDTLSRQ